MSFPMLGKSEEVESFLSSWYGTRKNSMTERRKTMTTKKDCVPHKERRTDYILTVNHDDSGEIADDRISFGSNLDLARDVASALKTKGYDVLLTRHRTWTTVRGSWVSEKF